MNENRLRRSTENRILGGLCGGLGEYFKIDPTIIRLAWIFITFWIGISAIIAYILGLIVVSVNKNQVEKLEEDADTTEPKAETGKGNIFRTNFIWGWLIIGVGVVILLENLGYFSRFKAFIFPGVLVVAGIWVLGKGFGK